mmetsp:Transcript_7919/g.15902  ORF Transcript_7919/g.15902 Transcript_7919/m.15902 type:complete len:149 (+) Transcript_7919:412-858(+)
MNRAGVIVSAYGVRSPLNKLAVVMVRDRQTLALNVFDSSVTKDVVKAIQGADLGFNPLLEGPQTVVVPVPPVSSTTLETLRKKTAQLGENTRISLRNKRRKAMDAVNKLSLQSKDQQKTLERKIQLETNRHVDEVDDLVNVKLSELRG